MPLRTATEHVCSVAEVGTNTPLGTRSASPAKLTRMDRAADSNTMAADRDACLLANLPLLVFGQLELDPQRNR